MGVQEKASRGVQKKFYGCFYNWGSFVARRPRLVILIAALLGIAGSVRLLLAFRFPLESVVEQDQLWVPQTAQAVTDKERYDAAFSSTFRRNTLYFTTSPPGGNVLTSEILEEIRRFDLTVTEKLNATAYASSGTRYAELEEGVMEDNGKAATYNDVCAKSDTSFGQNISDPEDTGAPGCVIFGHPLEAFYRIGGGVPRAPLWLPGDFVFDFSEDEIRDIVTSGRGPDTTLFPESSNRSINVDAIFGGIEKDSNGRVIKARSVAFTYLLDQAPEATPRRAAAEAWEDQLNYLIGARWCNTPPQSQGSAYPGGLRWESDLVEIYPQTAGATSRELGKMIRGDLAALNISFFIILAYAVFIFWKCSPHHSRVLLAISGCASVGLSIAFAYGFSTLVGFKLNPVINVLPFILIGIGVDDMFVLVSALDSESHDLPVRERMARAMGKAGVSITITSLTDLFAFALGASSQLPALATFCSFAAIGIAADFLLQISFFAGWMALDAYREKKELPDCCPCCTCCKPTGPALEVGCCCCFCCATQAESCPVKDGAFLKRVIVNFYIPLLRKPACKALVLIIFTVLAGVSGYCASQLKQDFQFRWFVSSDAALQDSFDVQDAYFANSGLPVNTVTPPSADFDYAAISSQKKLVALGEAINSNSWIEVDSINTWYPAFREWVHACGQVEEYTAGPLSGTSCVRRDCELPSFGSGEPVTRLLFPYCTHLKDLRDEGGLVIEDSFGVDTPGDYELKYLVRSDGSNAPDDTPVENTYVPPAKFWAYLDQFLADDGLGAALYGSEFVWVNNVTVRDEDAIAEGIKATRIRAGYKATDQAEAQVSSMMDLRTSVDSAGISGTFPYMFMYLYYEQYAIITHEAIQNLGLALAAVFVIVTLLVANIGATLLVMLCVVLVDIDILGLMWLWGVSIDSVAIINLVLAIGLSVDYSVHLAHCFMQTPGTRQERTDKALEEMGVAIVHGAISTFLAVLVLSTSKSYIFVIFFKQFFGICIFGAAHGLCFLPVLLSLIGPEYVDIGIEHEPADKAKVQDKADGMQMSMDITPSAADTILPTIPPSPPTSIEPPSAPPSAPSSEHGDGNYSPGWMRSRRVAPFWAGGASPSVPRHIV